jgi:type I restriction enzyme S subunit
LAINSALKSIKEGNILISRSGTLGRIFLVTKYLEGWIGSDDFIFVEVQQKINPGYIIAFFNTPYGKIQLLRETYGEVIDHFEEEHLKKVKIPIPSKDTQDKIGSLVIEAYNKKDRANQIEEEAIKKLENTLLSLCS